jgi:hypothetical protein
VLSATLETVSERFDATSDALLETFLVADSTTFATPPADLPILRATLSATLPDARADSLLAPFDKAALTALSDIF